MSALSDRAEQIEHQRERLYDGIQRMLADAWDEGYNEGALTGYSPMADSNTNPYREDA